MPTMMVTIDRAGRVVIPKEIRDRLELGPDSELDIEVEGDSIRLERHRRERRQLEFTGDGRPYFPAADGTRVSDLDVQRLRDADQR